MDRAVAVQEMCAAPGVSSSQCEASRGGWEPCSEGGRGPAGPAQHQGTRGLWWGLPLESADKEGFRRKKGIALAMVSSR